MTYVASQGLLWKRSDIFFAKVILAKKSKSEEIPVSLQFIREFRMKFH
jgi:hypothetical protein